MTGEAAIQQAPVPTWPSKLLTVVIVAAGVVLLYFNGVVAASLIQTGVGLTKAAAVVYLVAAVAIPVGVARRSRKPQQSQQGSRWAATRRAALVSIAMNIAVLPIVVAVLSI